MVDLTRNDTVRSQRKHVQNITFLYNSSIKRLLKDIVFTEVEHDLTSYLCYDNACFRFLTCVRVSMGDESTHYKSHCRAQMKKSVTYEVDICVTKAGVIDETQCECAAGMGPDAHCKHVCALLCGLLDFSKSTILQTEETCTSMLQTFNRPRKVHTGSPAIAVKLELGKRVADSTLVYDPRSATKRNCVEYNPYVRNITLNHMFHPKIPVVHSYSPANTHALDVDHDYMVMVASEQYLHDIEVTSITTHSSANIEENTRGQSQCKLWHKERNKRITSSNFGKVVKLTNKCNMPKFLNNLLQPPTLGNVPAVKYGHKHESVALNAYAENQGKSVVNAGLFVCKEYPFLAASPDGLVGTDCLVEVKCPYAAKEKPITSETVPYLSEVSGKLDLDRNHDYYYQVQGQLMITGRKSCDFVVFTKVDLKVVNILADKEFQLQMCSKLDSFFHSHFKGALLRLNFFKRYYMYNFT